MQLSKQNVHAVISGKSLSHIRLLACPECIQLMDDDTVSLSGLTLIANPAYRGRNFSVWCAWIFSRYSVKLEVLEECKPPWRGFAFFEYFSKPLSQAIPKVVDRCESKFLGHGTRMEWLDFVQHTRAEKFHETANFRHPIYAHSIWRRATKFGMIIHHGDMKISTMFDRLPHACSLHHHIVASLPLSRHALWCVLFCDIHVRPVMYTISHLNHTLMLVLMLQCLSVARVQTSFMLCQVYMTQKRLPWSPFLIIPWKSTDF